jgi:hypothetical protein
MLRDVTWIAAYNDAVEYEENYFGKRIIVTTMQQVEGSWKSIAELVDSGRRIAVPGSSDDRYPSEDEARRGALSRAAGAVDRVRTSKGKP